MHVQQGAVEVASLRWDPARLRLSGTARRPAGESGNLYFLMPRRMRVVNHGRVHLLKELLDFTVILRLPVSFERDRADFELAFEPWKLTPLAPRGLLRYATEQEWRAHMKKTGGPGDTRVYE
jgi:hypothetical protein